MTKIYTVSPGDGFEWVFLHNHEDFEALLELGVERVSESFQPLSAYRILEDEGETFRQADLPWIGSHFLVMRDHVREILEPVMADNVEFLPLQTDDGIQLWITHTLRQVPVLDLERSELKRFASSGRIMRIVRHHFLPAVVKAGSAFHLTNMKRGNLYLSEKVVDAVLQADLTGPKFTEIWDTEDS
ncbi:MAG: hypothetical protein GKR97_20635 [Rhizobiaceae bacterium]|nr:hypothetical protein [Rhizobiaceae bacterium]